MKPDSSHSMRLTLLLLLCAVHTATAQIAQPRTPVPGEGPAPTDKPLWRCTLPGGTYQVAVGAITAVSMHEYVVDAVARVTEVNVDTTGALVARFYFIEANAPKTPGGVGQAAIRKAEQLANEAGDRSGQDVWKKVIKNYPATTHARTVEYRVETKDQLTTIHASVEEAFRLNRNKSLKIE